MNIYMPNYKKRKHNKLFSSQGKPKKPQKKSLSLKDDIIMSSFNSKGKKVNKNEKMKVIKGKKLEQKRRFKLISISLAVIFVVIIVLQSILPAGIIESISNSLAHLGSGSYPIELESTNTINTVPRNSYYYVLTNSYVKAFSKSGKVLFSYAHGFENPMIKTSSSRAIVFNQGSTEALIFNHSGLKESLVTEKNIITAGVSDSGTYAIATHSDKYTSAVTVYSKSNKVLYEWYSANETVNNVALSPNGRKLAVSGFSSNVGEYKSTLYVLNYKSATPEYTEKVENSLIYNIDTTFRNGFTIITSNKLKFVKWFKYTSSEYSNDYNISYYKPNSNGSVAVFNRESDKTDNRIVVFSKSGKIKSEFTYKGIISDINLFSGHIYCMSETEIYQLNTEGAILKKASCGFGAVNFTVSAINNIAVITDSKIEKIKLEQENEK